MSDPSFSGATYVQRPLVSHEVLTSWHAGLVDLLQFKGTTITNEKLALMGFGLKCLMVTEEHMPENAEQPGEHVHGFALRCLAGQGTVRRWNKKLVSSYGFVDERTSTQVRENMWRTLGWETESQFDGAVNRGGSDKYIHLAVLAYRLACIMHHVDS